MCLHDRVLVSVKNTLPSSVVSMHWHGLTMDADPYMDGVGGLTQCPIQPGADFTYSFVANFPGTHYWHAQQGMYPLLSVRLNTASFARLLRGEAL